MQEQMPAQVENFITGRDFGFSMRWSAMCVVGISSHCCRLSKRGLFHPTRNMQ